ncbi:FAD-linked oxidase C-terminal domain-containing protein [Sorangium sp. So ce363]|uniref:FAD-linked oxidase C-terminal domain-containing protein n=1 Tax=Sorangium sp. So ce363 TaxID=3133304 RepID=UPI003F5E4F8F
MLRWRAVLHPIVCGPHFFESSLLSRWRSRSPQAGARGAPRAPRRGRTRQARRRRTRGRQSPRARRAPREIRLLAPTAASQYPAEHERPPSRVLGGLPARFFRRFSLHRPARPRHVRPRLDQGRRAEAVRGRLPALNGRGLAATSATAAVTSTPHQRHAARSPQLLRRTHEAGHASFSLVKRHRGSISAEHGIGLLKRDYLPYPRPAEALAIVRSIQRALEPLNPMNPGKILEV